METVEDPRNAWIGLGPVGMATKISKAAKAAKEALTHRLFDGTDVHSSYATEEAATAARAKLEKKGWDLSYGEMGDKELKPFKIN